MSPQYGYQIIEYAINIQNTEIIDFEMYHELEKLYVSIKQLEHMESLITETAGNYQYSITELESNHELNLERKANNRSELYRFKMFLRGRAGNLNRISKQAAEVLVLINSLLGEDRAKEIDLKFIYENMTWIESENEAVQLVLQYFPSLTEEEIRNTYQRANSEKKAPN